MNHSCPHFSLFLVTERMPPHNSFSPLSGEKSQLISNGQQETASSSIVKNHPLKKHQSKSFDDRVTPTAEQSGMQQKTKTEVLKKAVKSPILPSKNRLIRSNDILTQSSTETLLDILKAHAGIKECTEEIIFHINGVNILI